MANNNVCGGRDSLPVSIGNFKLIAVPMGEMCEDHLEFMRSAFLSTIA